MKMVKINQVCECVKYDMPGDMTSILKNFRSKSSECLSFK